MTETCIAIEDLEGITDLPAEDPRRRHLEGCPQCRALYASYREFMRQPPLPESALAADPDARLVEAIEREIFKGPLPGPGGRIAGIRRLESLRDRLGIRLALRPAVITAAAVLLILVGLQQIRNLPRSTPNEVILRNSAEEPAGPEFTSEARLLEGGGWAIHWSRFAQADAYRLVLYGTDMAELARLNPTSGVTSVTLKEEDLPLSAHDGDVFWKIIALRGGDEVAATRTQQLPLP